MGWVSGLVHLDDNVSSGPFFYLNQDIDRDHGPGPELDN